MAELLLVRSGDTDQPITERIPVQLDELKRFVGPRQLHYLGAELPPIGETSRVSEFTDPDHVVVNIGASELDGLGVGEQGFYVVEGLTPADVAQSGIGG